MCDVDYVHGVGENGKVFLNRYRYQSELNSFFEFKPNSARQVYIKGLANYKTGARPEMSVNAWSHVYAVEQNTENNQCNPTSNIH